LSEVAPAKVRVEILRGPPYFFDDHFCKYTWNVNQGGLDKDGDVMAIIIGTGYSMAWVSHPIGATINTNPWRYIAVRVAADFLGTKWTVKAKLAGVMKTYQEFTDTGLKTLDLYALNGNVHFDYDEITIEVYGAVGNYVKLDYVGICKNTVLTPIGVGDVVEDLTITKPVLSQGVSGAKLTIPNFAGAYNGQINKHDVIIIWLARSSVNLGEAAYKVFGGRVVCPSYRARGYGAHYVDLDCHGHAYELINPPALLQKLYAGTNGRTIIEDAVAVCSYLVKHPTAAKWFDNAGASGSTDDRINSTHECEYDEVKPKTVIDEISEKASNPAGVKGFDLVEMPSGVLMGHLRNSLDFVSPIDSITPEQYRKSEDIHRIKTRNPVYGAKEKFCPINDDWSESTDNWTGLSDTTISLDASDKKRGNYSIKATHVGDPPACYFYRTFPAIDCQWKYKKLHVWYKPGAVAYAIRLFAPNMDNRFERFYIVESAEWIEKNYDLGPKYEEATGYFGWKKVGSADWKNIQGIHFSCNQNVAHVDDILFGPTRYYDLADPPTEDYGIRFAEPIIDDSLNSDAECLARSESLRDFLKDPVITLENIWVDGNHSYTPGDRQRVIVSNDNYDAYSRIIEVQHKVVGVTWDIILKLSNEPQYIDYVLRIIEEAKKRLERRD